MTLNYKNENLMHGEIKENHSGPITTVRIFLHNEKNKQTNQTNKNDFCTLVKLCIKRTVFELFGIQNKYKSTFTMISSREAIALETIVCIRIQKNFVDFFSSFEIRMHFPIYKSDFDLCNYFFF